MCALLSDSGEAWRQTMRRHVVVCALAKTQTPTLSISELNHTAPILAVYASCRPRRRRRKTRFRRWSALPGGFIPQGSVEEFLPYMASLLPELTGAMRVRFANGNATSRRSCSRRPGQSRALQRVRSSNARSCDLEGRAPSRPCPRGERETARSSLFLAGGFTAPNAVEPFPGLRYI